MMYETDSYERKKKTSFTESLASVPQAITGNLPSMENRLGTYLDAHMTSLISEWGLVTRFSLEDLEHRLDAVSTEIGSLEKEKLTLKDRASAFEKALREVEE